MTTQMSMSTTIRIVVSGLDIYYGDFLAVKMSHDIEPRSITAFIGPSGCGKSTFLRSLNRMHEVIDGAHGSRDGRCSTAHDLYGPGVDPVAVRRKVGMVFQRPNPFPKMSIYDNVLPAKLNSKRSRRRERKRSSRSRCAAPTCGTRSRTASTSPGSGCPAVSSSGCASPGRSRSSPR